MKLIRYYLNMFEFHNIYRKRLFKNDLQKLYKKG